MANDKVDDKSGRATDDLLDRAGESRRALVKAVLGGAAAYAVPLLASFPMSGLRIVEAQASDYFVPPGLPGAIQAGNQIPPAFLGKAKGRPFTDPDFNPPGVPFSPNQSPVFF